MENGKIVFESKLNRYELVGDTISGGDCKERKMLQSMVDCVFMSPDCAYKVEPYRVIKEKLEQGGYKIIKYEEAEYPDGAVF